MIHRGNPLELSLEFEARTYNLGDTIDVFVELQPSTNVSVRSGRLDLVCEERYIQRGESFVPDFYGNTFNYSGQTSHVAQERKEEFVHSTVQFMEETRLTGDCSSSRRNGRLVDCYTFAVQTTIEVQADVLAVRDSYLYLIEGPYPGGTGYLESDNDGGLDSNDARIKRVLTPGIYTLAVTTYFTNTKGDYTLRLSSRSGFTNS